MITASPNPKPPISVTATLQTPTLTSAFAEITLGHVLATVTDRGLCSVILGSNPETMLNELHQRYPKYQITTVTTPAATHAASAIARYIDQPTAHLPNLPLDIWGTSFQRLVWDALREIPAGTTTTYGEIARHIGAPNAVRAVGAACGANRLAVIIPCHRVIASNGKLTGYRWGLEWKRTLLEREAQLTNFGF